MAKRYVGPTGNVCGIDASVEMIDRAGSKARKAGVDVEFQNAAAQALPFPDAGFNAVLGTMMLHHLGRNARRQFASEMRRVVKAGGRVLLVDFAASTRSAKRLMAHLHEGHGHVDPREIEGLLGDVGLSVLESGAVGIKDLHFVLAAIPRCA